MATTEAMARTTGVSTDEEGRNATEDTPRTTHRPGGEDSLLDTAALITLVRRAPALAALREQPLDRRDLEARLDVSKPTVHRLVRTLDEMGLVERASGLFVLTELGETIADVVVGFTRSVEMAYRLTPLLETVQYQSPTLDVMGFADATVTTAGPGDPYRPMRRYYSLVEESNTLSGFDTTTLPPEYVDAFYRQIHDGLETELVYPPAVITHLLSARPERTTELVGGGHLDLHVHSDLPYGLTIFDERVAVASYCETTGALRAVIDTDSPVVRKWAEKVYAEYRAEATALSEHVRLTGHPTVRERADAD